MTYDSEKWKSAKDKVLATPITSDGWKDISSAPRDGTVLNVRRVVDGSTLFEGLASWRTVHFPALPPHPIDGSLSGHEAYDATGWMTAGQEKRFPEPTHWRPAAT